MNEAMTDAEWREPPPCPPIENPALAEAFERARRGDHDAQRGDR